MEQLTAVTPSTKDSDDLRPADVRDRVRAALEANAAELAARRRWATIYRGGRPAPSRVWARHLLESLSSVPPAA